MPPERGVFLLDRHIEKNGGTSFRMVLHAAEAAGRCLYWGYFQKSATWSNMIAAMQALPPEVAHPPRLCIEAHAYIDYGGLTWSQRLAQLAGLRARFAARSVPMRVLLHVRLRDPVRYYISFFTWIVAARQDKDPRAFGRNFTEWASMTPNLQAEILLSSAMAGAFERGRATKTTPCLGRCTTPRALDARLGCTPRMHAWYAPPTFPRANTAEYGKLAYVERTVWLTPTGIHPHHRYLQANTASYWNHFAPSGIILYLPPPNGISRPTRRHTGSSRTQSGLRGARGGRETSRTPRSELRRPGARLRHTTSSAPPSASTSALYYYYNF